MKQALPSLQEIVEGQIILIDKPIKWTSFDAINKLKWLIHTKIGHAGTLDPLATGLLVCCTGKMTKQIQFLQKVDKEYIASIQLGAITASYDLESPLEEQQSFSHLTKMEIEDCIASFLGTQEQTPPIHSAIKKDGVRAYKLARAGEHIELKSRTVVFHALDILDLNFEKGTIELRIHCSTGTYIRSLAHDIGQKLKVGAHLSGLIRTKVGDYDLKDATSVEEWVKYLEEENEKFPEIKEERKAHRKRSRRGIRWKN